MKLSDQIRLAVDQSELSRYRIAKSTSISHPTMSRFMARRGGLSMEFADRVADFLDLNILIDDKQEAGK